MINCYNQYYSTGSVLSVEGSADLRRTLKMSSGFSDNDDEIDFQAVYQSGSIEEPFASVKSTKDSNAKDDRPKPKRPLSAYNWFFQMERQKILEETPTRKEGKPRRSHGKIGFADLARMIAAKWKSLSKEDRVTFDEKAAIDKVRYVQEMQEWKQGQSVAVSQAVSSSAIAYGYGEPISFMNDTASVAFARVSSNLFSETFEPVPPPERLLADEMKMSGTGADIPPMEPYSLTDAFGAQLTRRRNAATSQRMPPSQQRTSANMDTLASQLGDESTQLFLNLFRD
jgi:HMG-box domain